MARSVELGKLEDVVDRLVASGRYNSKSEVLREGVRLVEEREKRLEALDAALAKGLDDVEAGRVKPLREVAEHVVHAAETNRVLKVPLALLDLSVTLAMGRPARPIRHDRLSHPGRRARVVDPPSAIAQGRVEVRR